MELEGVGRLIVRWQVGQEETVENQVARQCAWTAHSRRVTAQGNNSWSGQGSQNLLKEGRGERGGGRTTSEHVQLWAQGR